MQRRLLEKHRSTTEHGYLGKEATKTRREEFSKKKDQLIKEWERETGQSWPTYRKDVPSADPNGPPFRTAGSYYDAHEIIPNSYGGPQEWWNIHPAKAPVQHQGGIHGEGRKFSEMFPLD